MCLRVWGTGSTWRGVNLANWHCKLAKDWKIHRFWLAKSNRIWYLHPFLCTKPKAVYTIVLSSVSVTNGWGKKRRFKRMIKIVSSFMCISLICDTGVQIDAYITWSRVSCALISPSHLQLWYDNLNVARALSGLAKWMNERECHPIRHMLTDPQMLSSVPDSLTC